MERIANLRARVWSWLMIALLIGGTVVVCIGLLAVVFGVPIKEFSFGNTMILAGSVVSCTGLVLIGLYFIGREFRNLSRRLEAGIVAPVPIALPGERVEQAEAPPKSRPAREDMLFTRDQSPDLARARDEFADELLRDTASRAPKPPAEPATSPAPWQDHPITRVRHSAPAAESLDPPAEPAERPRRNIMFSSHRRENKSRDLLLRDQSPPTPDDKSDQPPAEDFQRRDTEAGAADPFDQAWPPSSWARAEGAAAGNGQVDPPPAVEDSDASEPEPVRERFQLPRRADASSVTIVKSGVVDSMAYSLYSDGSIEAQMPEGMVRFASIDELRAHLDQRN